MHCEPAGQLTGILVLGTTFSSLAHSGGEYGSALPYLDELIAAHSKWMRAELVTRIVMRAGISFSVRQLRHACSDRPRSAYALI